MKPINAQRKKKKITRGEKRKNKGGKKAKFCLLRMPEDSIKHLDSAWPMNGFVVNFSSTSFTKRNFRRNSQ